jgi:hypothetical protein
MLFNIGYMQSLSQYCLDSVNAAIAFKQYQYELKQKNPSLKKSNFQNNDLNSLTIELTDVFNLNTSYYNDHSINLEESKSDFEEIFNTDLNDVNIHTGAYAEELARQSDAKAVTIDKDIYFGAGEYAPHTEEGMSLLAHEITHAVQSKEDMRFAYPEDIRKAEEEAGRVESRFKQSSTNENDNFLFQEEGYINDERSDKIKDINEIDTDARNNAYERGELRSKEQLYMITMRDSGRKYLVTESERKKIIENTKEILAEKIREKRVEMTTEAYERYLLKFMSWGRI